MNWTDLPLARATVDRAAERRSEPDLVDRLRADPATRVVLVRSGLVATRDAGSVLDLVTPAEATALAPGVDGWLFLGADDERSYLGRVLPDPAPAPDSGPAPDLAPGTAAGSSPDPADPADPAVAPDLSDPADPAEGHAFAPAADEQGSVTSGAAQAVSPGPHAAGPSGSTADSSAPRDWSHLRTVGAAMPARDAGLGVTAVALAAWHRSHRCCPRCGTPTDVGQAGWVRRCPTDGREQYPRTDPAVIMAVVDDDDRLLLGHAAHWPDRRFSTLAGYVEPGEGLEQAVRREVGEEVGIAIGEVSYRGSQPWPFPASIMLAFVARATSTDIVVDAVEVTEARWFTRDELLSAAASGEVLLPSTASIARALIEEWAGTTLPGS